MAFLVLLQRLTPAERAALLLHDVFDLDYAEIAALLGKGEAACRQLVSRARANVAAERRAFAFEASAEEHRRLLRGFMRAIADGDREGLFAMLAADATLVVDAGSGGARFGRIRSVGKPVVGGRRIAAFFAAVAREGRFPGTIVERELNGQPAVIRVVGGKVVSAVTIAVVGGKVGRVFVQADGARLERLGQAGYSAPSFDAK